MGFRGHLTRAGLPMRVRERRVLGSATRGVPGTPYPSRVPGTSYPSQTLPREFRVLGRHTYLPTLPAGMAMGAAERRLQRHPDHRAAVRGALPRGVVRQHRDGRLVSFVKFEDGRAIKQGAIHLESLIPKVGLEPTPSCEDRILSPGLLPYSWYWKHVGVTLKGFGFKAVTMPP